jgi:hypothetical protein
MAPSTLQPRRLVNGVLRADQVRPVVVGSLLCTAQSRGDGRTAVAKWITCGGARIISTTRPTKSVASAIE